MAGDIALGIDIFIGVVAVLGVGALWFLSTIDFSH